MAFDNVAHNVAAQKSASADDDHRTQGWGLRAGHIGWGSIGGGVGGTGVFCGARWSDVARGLAYLTRVSLFHGLGRRLSEPTNTVRPWYYTARLA